jgi:hypothetical protein
MRRIREALRLHLQAGLSYSEVGRALKISKSAVGKYVSLAKVAGVDCAVADGLDDAELESRLYRPAVPRASHQLAPDFGLIHQELKRSGVTLMLLWEEYATGNPLAYKYTSFCIKYREFAKTQARSMRQIHIAGEKLFVDYAGSTVPIIDASTGEITQAQIFVATLGASNYTFACATPRQTTADWIGAQVLALEFIGGSPQLSRARDNCGNQQDRIMRRNVLAAPAWMQSARVILHIISVDRQSESSQVSTLASRFQGGGFFIFEDGSSRWSASRLVSKLA